VTVKVRIGDLESLENALKRFRRMVLKAGNRSRWRPKFGKKSLLFYKKPSELRREKELSAKIEKKKGWHRYVGPSAGPYRIRARLRQISRI
jgi:ribosomal protein S21